MSRGIWKFRNPTSLKIPLCGCSVVAYLSIYESSLFRCGQIQIEFRLGPVCPRRCNYRFRQIHKPAGKAGHRYHAECDYQLAGLYRHTEAAEYLRKQQAVENFACLIFAVHFDSFQTASINLQLAPNQCCDTKSYYWRVLAACQPFSVLSLLFAFGVCRRLGLLHSLVRRFCNRRRAICRGLSVCSGCCKKDKTSPCG